MAQYYVVALMETHNASNRRGIGYRSFWLGHSGPYETRDACAQVADSLTGSYGVKWRGAEYFCVDAMPTEHNELGIYGLDRKRPDMQVLLPGIAGVR